MRVMWCCCRRGAHHMTCSLILRRGATRSDVSFTNLRGNAAEAAMKATETEIKLTVPDRTVFEEILSLDSIAGLRLEDRGLQPHRDIYCDTADLLLYRSKVVFRIREKNGCQVLTFKAQAPSDGAAYRRVEIEETITIEQESLERGCLPGLQTS